VPDRLLISGLRGTPSAILVEDGRIAAFDADALSANASQTLAAAEWTAHPGFIDLQVNGIDDLDFTSDPSAIGRAGEALAAHGVTAFLPTIVSSRPGTVEAAIAAWREATATPAVGARPIGLHVEGPFLSARRAGAHDPAALRPPDLEEIDRWVADGVRMITLAPELPGGCEAIARVSAAGAVAAIGHTDADAATTVQAIEAGARYATHVFNAMPPLGHREPGPVGAILDDARMTVGLIADGRHVDPLVLGIAARAARGRLSLVSDLVGGRLGHQPLERGQREDGTLAGGRTGLDAGVRTMAAIIGLEAAVEAVTATPTALLGLDDGSGALRIGGVADIVLLTERLEVAATIVRGERVFGMAPA
jgi:N-acetylglucosamine-6-phosphate deacetylase